MNTTRTYSVKGMSCGHCEGAIHSELAEIEGVADIVVSAQTGRLTLTTEPNLDDSDVVAAVEEAGYTASRS
ncbi:heavy-metal-associated domain-containing protein [Nesterenkonia salmonea]|uniref:Heavy-metal-associated domain-containing protein n=1 Tax=Nesterenkonia salmonea TaxID=1804987 RepID=A0A5R9B9C9_9MICC|nr:heavy metal-associated domain-containing protein [Nesterenkonia salmonea]TLP93052.1 heavy-metal-associated domain-containing protein [Nesterenkonia salmonea]